VLIHDDENPFCARLYMVGGKLNEDIMVDGDDIRVAFSRQRSTKKGKQTTGLLYYHTGCGMVTLKSVIGPTLPFISPRFFRP